MPNWGLTSGQQALRPWGLSPELLSPCKTVTDPVHGDVYLNRLEALIADSPPMQRLRRVRQLGTTHLVYPGATHSRFSHALGTLRAAQNLLDAVWNSQTNPQARDLRRNLLAEWEQAGDLDQEFAKATVLARLGGLMHDLCHIPLGHTIEDDLLVLDPHDGNKARFDRLWSEIDEAARSAIEQAPGLLDELRVLIISKDEHATTFASDYPFVGDIVGNTICADLIDYIQRDHHNTGLPLALGHRFLDSFFVVPSDHPHFARRMVINVDREGRHREDIITELVKYLRYRYELTERVLTHHAKTAADAMLGKMLELWHDDLWLAEAVATATDVTIATHGSVDDARAAIRSHVEFEPTDDQPEAADIIAVTTSVKERIEDEFLRRSDDGMLEFLADAGPEPSPRRTAVATLAQRLLNRDLYKIIGHAGGAADQAIARETWEKFAKNPHDRLQLEREAAAFAGIKHGWHVVVWLPNDKMRLKVADVLVHRDGAVAPLSRVEPTSQAIVDQHTRLWAVTVYAPDHVRADADSSDAVLAYIGDKTALTFRRPDGSVVPSRWELAVDQLMAEIAIDAPARDDLLDLVPSARTTEGPTTSFKALVDALRIAARENHLPGFPDS